MPVARLRLLILLLICFPAFGQQTPVAEQAPDKPDAPTLDLTPDANGALSQGQMRELFRVVAEKDRANNKLQRNYTYIEREVENRLDGKGKTKSTEVKTFEVLEIYGEQVERLIERDDKPLSAKDAAKEEEKIQKIIDKRKNESEGDRRKREARAEKEREDGRKFEAEVLMRTTSSWWGRIWSAGARLG